MALRKKVWDRWNAFYCFVLFYGVLLLHALVLTSQAQITLDGSLGSAGPLTGPNYVIPAAAGQLRGTNLFHSFGEFNINTGEQATFTGPDTVSHILGRVTGGNPSLINGLLQSQILGAEVFLLNPQGVMFGPNASLDVPGGFHVSTADYLRLADGERFSAHLLETSVLSVAPPVAFGFLGPQAPAAIHVQGSSLQVPAHDRISLVGGEIEIAGAVLRAPSGHLTLASVASAGEVVTTATGAGNMAPDVSAFTHLGPVTLAQGAHLDTTGDGGGSVVIRGERLLIDQAAVTANTLRDINGAPVAVDIQVTDDLVVTNQATISAHVGLLEQIVSGGAGNAGNIQITAASVEVDNGATIRSLALSGSTGNRGDIIINTGSLHIRGGAQLDTGTLGDGLGGTISLTATDDITISARASNGTVSFVGSNVFAGQATGGSVHIQTATLTMDDSLIQVLTTQQGRGAAGTITVDVGRLTLTGGAQLSSSTRTGGQGGTVMVQAREAITISGTSQAAGNPSGIFSAASNMGSGGRVDISTPLLMLTEGALVGTSSSGQGHAGEIVISVGSLAIAGGARIDSSTSGLGNGGTVTVTATEALTITGRTSTNVQSRIDSSTRGQGQAGRLVMTAPTITLADGGAIQAQTTGVGNAGEIDVTADTLTLLRGGTINSSTTGAGQGGTIQISATEAIVIMGHESDGTPSRIDSSNEGGQGAAGRLTIMAPALSLADRGVIQATTAGAGQAGEIHLAINNLSLVRGAQISSSSTGSGQGGTVSIQAAQAIMVTGADRTGTPSQIVSTTGATGAGGNLQLTAPTVTLRDGARISANSTGAGNAGTIELVARDTLRSQNGRVTTAAELSGGGNISLQAGLIQMTESTLSATVQGGTGGGGDISMQATSMVLNNSQVIAQADLGMGGNIDITAQEAILADPTSIIDASARRGINGTVDIRSPVTNISGTLAPLSQSFAATAVLARERCGGRSATSQASRFVLAGRDSVPLEPGGMLPSPAYASATGGISRPADRQGRSADALRNLLGPQEPLALSLLQIAPDSKCP